jgi:hypothetical protein
MKLSTLIDNLKSYQSKLSPQVTDLKDFKGNLEAEIHKYQADKDKRDRIGFIVAKTMANTTCDFDNLMTDDSVPTKMMASQQLQYKKFFFTFHEGMNRELQSSGEVDEYNGQGLGAGEEEKRPDEFITKVKEFLRRVSLKGFTLGEFDKDGENFEIPLIKSKLHWSIITCGS